MKLINISLCWVRMLLLSVDPARHSVNLITPLTTATIKIYFRSADLISSEEKEREREREREREGESHLLCPDLGWGY